MLHKGKLVNSGAHNFLPRLKGERSYFDLTFEYEGAAPCHATTPLGQAIACPMEKDVCVDHRLGSLTKEEDSDRCDVVYLGHNAFGT